MNDELGALLAAGDGALTQDSIEHRERAYVEFRRRPDPVQATKIALVLCVHYQTNVGNPAAAAGWLAQAKRLVEEYGLEDFRGMASSHGGRPRLRIARRVRNSHAIARIWPTKFKTSTSNSACSLKSVLPDQAGKGGRGARLFDEAVAGALGGAGANFGTVVFTSFEMIGSCASCAYRGLQDATMGVMPRCSSSVRQICQGEAAL